MASQLENITTNDLEFINYIDELYIHPLKELGFRLTNYGSFNDIQQSYIIHNLIFEHDNKTYLDYNRLKEIGIQDDDNQPHSTFRLYLGTLFIFIPVCR